MVAKAPTVRLSSGFVMPVVGLGTYARKAEPGQFRQAVEWGIELGYRHIDTASCYKNEEEVGEAIGNKIKQGVVTRVELFVTTKLWSDKHAEADVLPSLKESLAKLRLDYVDLYLIHWPVSFNDKGEDAEIDYLETWKGMEKLVDLGLTKSIGVSNFNEEQLERLLKVATIKPVVNQIEINPTLTQHSLVDYCKTHSIIPVAYTPLGLISEARPEFAGKDAIKTDPKLGEIADKYGNTRAQIALKYLVQRGIAVVPKSFTKSRIAQNIDIFDFQLTPEEMAVVDSYNIDHRCVPGLALSKLKYFPFLDRMVGKAPTVKLSNGYVMPVVGLGTYAAKSEPGQYRQAVEWSIDLGYRHIDTASIYKNEEEVGEGIDNKIKDGVVKREELFVTTKLWNDRHAEADVLPSLKASLARLRLDYVDLYLVHWPVSTDENDKDTGIDYLETWRGMEKLISLGLTKSIGVSNFNEEQLERLLQAATIKPVVNQIEISPTLTQHGLVDFCKSRSVIPVAYTPLGLISVAWPEPTGKDIIKSDPKLGELAKKYGRSRSQIALKYLLQRGIPVIPKSFTKARIAENIDLFDFQLTDDEIALVDSYNINHRCVPKLEWTDNKNYPF
ncbi:uncharacterized protein LOC106137092 [Amyelois transitella]|uniref:uncharacterized protein LOC106137092 n=1 Tax=Amyelois transitella TaxID=680683 RepID=UPI00298F555A|nr:uncharacterized protein LOC106137092 [Amyelois transitella]